MSGAVRCMSCMHGVITAGRCSHCGRHPVPPEERRADALPIGLKLHGRYIVGDVLGRGGFGITYAAWDIKENRRVAVKELYPKKDVSRGKDNCSVMVKSGQEEYFSQIYRCFEKEARILMELQQDGVVRLYHLFNDYYTIYYVMEYLDGQDLSNILKQNGPISWSDLVPVIKTVLNALDCLHRRGMIHRDISPDNIFITRDGRAQLIDFGSVRTYQGNNSFTTFIKQSFAPLEQYKTNGQQGPWTDIYALCVTIYYALSGKIPPTAPERWQNDTTIPIEQLCCNLPSHVANAVRKGMCVSIEGRYKNVGELASILFPKENAVTGGRQLCCISGIKSGQVWWLQPGTQLTIGRQDCTILYNANEKGISRNQCTIYMDDTGHIMVRDNGSSGGTFYMGMRMNPGIWYLLKPGNVLSFAYEQYQIR